MFGPKPGAPNLRDALALTALVAACLGWWLVRFVLEAPDTEPVDGDLRFYYFPLYDLTSAWVSAGNLPVWNPWNALGTPWLATLQTGFFYPPHLLYLIFDTSTALAVSQALHLLVIAIGTAAFARGLGLATGAAVLAALLYSLRGLVPWSLQYPSLLEAGSWLPWGCLAVAALARGRRRGGVLGLAACTALSLLAGYPQATVALLYTWGTLGLVLIFSERNAGSVGRGLLAFAVAVALGVLASAIQLLPTFELTWEGARSASLLTEDRVYSIGGGGLWRLRESLGSGLAAVGALPLALAPAALLVRRRRVFCLWAAAFGLLAHALASGAHPSLVELYRSIPTLGWFRHTTRLTLVSHFCLAMLSAVTLDAIARGRPLAGSRSTAVPSPGSGAAVAGVALLLACAVAVKAGQLEIASGAAVAAGLAILLIAALLVRSRAWLAPACVVLALAEVTFGGTRTPPLPYSGEYERVLDAERPFHARLAAAAGSGRVAWPGFGPPSWGLVKIAGRSGVRSFEDYEPLALGRYASYRHHLRTGSLGAAGGVDLRRTWLSFGKPKPGEADGFWTRSRLLDLAAVRLVVVPQAFTQWRRVREILTGMGLVRTDLRHPTEAVFENPNALPRAYVTYRTLASPAAPELLERLSRPDFDPLTASYVEDLDAFEPPAGGPNRGHAARIVRDEATEVEIEASLEAPGLLVLADAVASGWRAEVNGEPARIVAANHLFRGVALPAGEHRVRFRHRPAGVVAGASVSAVALALLIGIGVRPRLRAR